jgi:hypothetical protein
VRSQCPGGREAATTQLGLNKIWTEIYEFDEPRRKLYAKLNLK